MGVYRRATASPPLHFVPTLQHAGTKRLLSIDHEQIILQPCNVAMIEQGPAAGRSATPVGTSEADQNRQWLAKKGFSQLATSDILAVFFVLQTRET